MIWFKCNTVHFSKIIKTILTSYLWIKRHKSCSWVYELTIIWTVNCVTVKQYHWSSRLNLRKFKARRSKLMLYMKFTTKQAFVATVLCSTPLLDAEKLAHLSPENITVFWERGLRQFWQHIKIRILCFSLRNSLSKSTF